MDLSLKVYSSRNIKSIAVCLRYVREPGDIKVL